EGAPVGIDGLLIAPTEESSGPEIVEGPPWGRGSVFLIDRLGARQVAVEQLELAELPPRPRIVWRLPEDLSDPPPGLVDVSALRLQAREPEEVLPGGGRVDRRGQQRGGFVQAALLLGQPRPQRQDLGVSG